MMGRFHFNLATKHQSLKQDALSIPPSSQQVSALKPAGPRQVSAHTASPWQREALANGEIMVKAVTAPNVWAGNTTQNTSKHSGASRSPNDLNYRPGVVVFGFFLLLPHPFMAGLRVTDMRPRNEIMLCWKPSRTCPPPHLASPKTSSSQTSPQQEGEVSPHRVIGLLPTPQTLDKTGLKTNKPPPPNYFRYVTTETKHRLVF